MRPPSPFDPPPFSVVSPPSSDLLERASSRPVVLGDDSLFLEHVAPPDHPERGERLVAVRRGLAQAAAAAQATTTGTGRSDLVGLVGLVGRAGQRQPRGELAGPGLSLGEGYLSLPPTDATVEQLSRVHHAAYLDTLDQLAGRSAYLDSDTFVSPGSVAAARRAAGSAVQLVDALVAGRARFGIAVPRPPGHHALPDRAMGFCLLNNVAVAAAHARALGHERVLVLDWDVHHGNGTQEMFYGDPSVLFVSLHQFPNYPGTGDVDEQGRGEGVGATVNLALPKGATDAVYAAALARIVLPIVEQFRPTFALVSAGFDAHERDPLAEMRLSAEGFGNMTRSLIRTLDATCPLGIVLEGGYDLEALESSTREVASALLREPLENADPPPGQASLLPAAHETALGRIRAHQSAHWRLG